MYRYIGKRLLQLIPILLGITILSFALMYSVTGDAVDAFYDNAGGEVSEHVKEEARHRLGLDEPFLQQYVSWLGHTLQGDMGVSYITKKPILPTFTSKLPNTLYLTITSVLLTMAISIPLGILAAIKQNKFIDYLIRFFSFVGNSLPNFFVSLLLILFFSVKFNLFSVLGSGNAESIVLPTLTLAISMSAKYTRQVRTAVLEELNKEYVIAARARGIREYIIFRKSVLPVVMLTIVTLLSLSIGSLLGGTAIVESIFMWDGVGKLAIDAIMMRDYPCIQAYVVWMAFIYVFVNLISDIFYHALDPRIRLEEE
jgi:peptide/nickel transport system permease protein